MVGLRAYRDYFIGVALECGISKVILVATEADFGDRTRNLATKDFPVMILVIPSADSVAPDPDSITEIAACLLYVVTKVDSTRNGPEDLLKSMEDTQNFMNAVKSKMLADKSDHGGQPHLMHQLDMNRMHTDPEYNYLGCNGWSLSFNLKSPHF